MTRKAKTTATIAETIAAKQAAESNEARAATGPNIMRFVIEGEPVGKERARVFSKANASGTVVTRAVTPEKTRAYEAKVKTIAKIAVNQNRWAWSKDDVFTIIVRVFTTHRKRHPDLSNVVKALEDACNSILWGDDRDVLDMGAVLRQDAARPRVEMEVRRRRQAA